MARDSVIDGYSFADSSDITIAEEEIKRIKYITSKINMDNPKAVLTVYDKLISSGIFVTPVGIEYLRTLQNFLFRSPEINDEDVRNIPVAISYSGALNKRSEDRERRMDEIRSNRTLRKTFRTEYKVSLIINVILFIAVIGMFIITLKADNPNMINYRTAIINQYSEWEQNLSEREEALKIRERDVKLFEQEHGLTDYSAGSAENVSE